MRSLEFLAPVFLLIICEDQSADLLLPPWGGTGAVMWFLACIRGTVQEGAFGLQLLYVLAAGFLPQSLQSWCSCCMFTALVVRQVHVPCSAAAFNFLPASAVWCRNVGGVSPERYSAVTAFSGLKASVWWMAACLWHYNIVSCSITFCHDDSHSLTTRGP